MITKIKRKIVDYLENRKARIEVERTRKLAEAEGLIIRCPAFTDFFEVVLDTPDEVHFVKQKAENLGVEIEFKYDSDPNSTYEMPIGMKVKAVRLFQIINFLFDWIIADQAYEFGHVLTVVKPANMPDEQFKSYFNLACKWFMGASRFKYLVEGIKDGGPMKKWLQL